MNFADMIRQASHEHHKPLIDAAEYPEAIRETHNDEHVSPQGAEQPKESMNDPKSTMNATDSHGPLNVVRLEVLVTPEQLSGLFRALVANQHTVFTLGEAAKHLRVHTTTLEKLAGEGKVPAFRVEGKWRFSRQALDEWLLSQQNLKEAS